MQVFIVVFFVVSICFKEKGSVCKTLFYFAKTVHWFKKMFLVNI